MGLGAWRSKQTWRASQVASASYGEMSGAESGDGKQPCLIKANQSVPQATTPLLSGGSTEAPSQGLDDHLLRA